jgi:hypothetical protein
MFLRVTMYIIIMFMVSLPAVAVECKTDLIGITVFFLSHGDEWSITWKTDGVHKKKDDYNSNLGDYRTNYNNGFGDKRSESLPQKLLASDKQFNVPFAILLNDELLIATVYKASSFLTSRSKQLAVVDLKRQKIVRTVETEYYVQAVAWAPDSKYFAVLYEQDVTKQVFKGPLDWLASLVGHPIGYWTFYLTIYQPDGTELCTTLIEKKLPDAMSYMDWKEQ